MRLEQRRYSEQSFLIGAVAHTVSLLNGCQEAGRLHQEDVGRLERTEILRRLGKVIFDFYPSLQTVQSRTGDLAPSPSLCLPSPLTSLKMVPSHFD